MAKQSTIKNDPLEADSPVDLLLSGKNPSRAKPPEPAQGRGDEPAKSAGKKEKLTVHLTHDLIERVKNAAYWNPRLTIAAIAERGIAAVIEDIERENGGPYPSREEELKGGRPIGSRNAGT